MAKTENNHKISFLENNSARPSQWSSFWGKVESTCSLKKSENPSKQENGDPNFPSDRLFPEHEPDTRLENWKKWLDIHKKQQDKLSNILKRPSQCLIMNMNFSNLYVNQQKQVLKEASGYEFIDKYRGHPSFWSTDYGAESGGKKLGIYQPIQKRYDRSHPNTQGNWCPAPTELQFVGVPDVIMKEKGLSGDPCLPLPKDNWNMSSYVAKKKENLKDKIDLFQEHTPQSEELAVVGRPINFKKDSQIVNFFELENQIFSGSISEGDISSEKSESLIQNSISVEIDDKIMDTTLKMWTIYFSDSVMNECCEKSINIENLSECCLRYSWEAILPDWIKSPLPLKQIRNRRKTFSFNKNDNVVLPNSKVKLTFYLESMTTGVFVEKWKLIFSNSPDQEEYITVELQAVVEEKLEIEENLKNINTYIESCTRYNIASKTVKEILDRSRPERPTILPYDWMFFEEQIFMFNNPDLFYDSKYVSFLKDMYKQISEGPWDLSIQTLRKILLEKALHEDMTETMNAFTATVCHLMKPKLNFSFSNEKHKSVNELLCCFIDKIVEESDKLMGILKIPLEIASSLNISNEDILIRSSGTAKLISKENTNKKSNQKKSLTSRSSVKKSLYSQLEGDSFLEQTTITGDSNGTMSYELEEKIKRQEYLEALYIKSYHHLCKTIDNISAVIDSFDFQKKKSPLVSLKENRLYLSVN